MKDLRRAEAAAERACAALLLAAGASAVAAKLAAIWIVLAKCTGALVLYVP